MADAAPPLPAAAAAAVTEAMASASVSGYNVSPCPVKGCKRPNPYAEQDKEVMAALRKDAQRYLEPCAMTWGDFEEGLNVFNAVAAKDFELRGPHYLKDKKKMPSQPAAFRFVTLSSFVTAKPLFHVASKNPTLKKRLAEPDCPYLMIVNFLVPKKGKTLCTPMVFARTLPVGVDPQFDKTWDRFMKSDDSERHNTFKMIANIKKAPLLVNAGLKMVGGMKPVLTGNKIKQKYFVGKNYLEIDLDIAGSKVIKKLSGLILTYLKGMVCNLGFVLQAGHQEGELPERLLGAVRTRKADLKKCLIPSPWAEESGTVPAAATAAAAADEKP